MLEQVNEMKYLPGKFKISKKKIASIIEILKLEKNEIKQMKKNRKKVAMSLKTGDTQLAKVINLNPLLISCYSDEFDSVLVYKYPIEFVGMYDLQLEQILITSNMYWSKDGFDLESDILQKEDHKYFWRDAITFIPLFLCDNDEYIYAFTKNRITNKSLEILDAATNEYLEKKPDCVRDGLKTLIYY